MFIPVFDKGIPLWLWPILVAIWLPGIAGLILGYYAIIVYPNISLSMGWTPTLTSNRWLWFGLGLLFWLYGIIAGAAFVGSLFARPLNVWVIISCGYFSMASCFGGFLLTNFNHRRHPAVATFILLTFGYGIAAVPLYVPALVIGSIRCRQLVNANIRKAD